MQENLLGTKLVSALIGLARATDKEGHEPTENTHKLFLDALNSFYKDEKMQELAARKLLKERELLLEHCSTCENPCGRVDLYDREKAVATSTKDVNEFFKCDNIRVEIFKFLGQTSGRIMTTGRKLSDEEMKQYVYRPIFLIGEDLGEKEYNKLLGEIIYHFN